MRTVLINTYDRLGGAAIAARRLHKGLAAAGAESLMIVRQSDFHDDASVIPLFEGMESPADLREPFWVEGTLESYLDKRRTGISNTYFSLPYPGWDISGLPELRGAEVINLHWVARFLSPVSLQRLFSLGKPVVWTLHDQHPFSGGCHYSAGCEGYRLECSGCPQIEPGPFDLPAMVLKDKAELWRGAQPVIVTPSLWMAGCASASALFKGLRIEVIPNGIDTEEFKPGNREEVRKRLGIEPDAFVVLFSADNLMEKRKNIASLCTCLNACLEDLTFADRARKGKTRVLAFGSGSEEVQGRIGLPVSGLGRLSDLEWIRDAYGAADVFVLSSLEDNLPNTVMEAMACGTPVAAFEVGGVPEMIEDGKTGRLAAAGDLEALTRAILDLAGDSAKRLAMGERCRRVALERFALGHQAAAYLALFEELSVKNGRGRQDAQGRKSFATGPGEPVFLRETGPRFASVYAGILMELLKETLLSGEKNAPGMAAEADRFVEAGKFPPARIGELKRLRSDIEKDSDETANLIGALEGAIEDLRKSLDAVLAQRDGHLDALVHYEQTAVELRDELDVIYSRTGCLQDENESLRMKISSFETEADENKRRWADHIRSNHSMIKEMDDIVRKSPDLKSGTSLPVRRFLASHKPFAELHEFLMDENFRMDLCEGEDTFNHYFRLLDELYLASLRLLKTFDFAEPAESGVAAASIDAPVIEALSFARTLGGDFDDRAMAFLFELAVRLKRVLVVNATRRNLQAACIMAGAGAEVMVLGVPSWVKEREKAFRFEVQEEPLAEWLGLEAADALARYDGLVWDNEAARRDVRLIKGRLGRDSLIVQTGGAPAGEDPVLAEPMKARTFHGVRILEGPPAAWLDPAANDKLVYSSEEWPRRTPVFELPQKMPSGNPWPKISVVTVTLNQGIFLEETIRSVLMQGYPNLEYILIDGGSTDGTSSILERYRHRFAFCVSEKDKGQSDALNKGFRQATGEILAWLNSDDRYLPWTLVRVAMAFDQYGPDMVAGGCELVHGFEKKPFHRHHNAMPVGEVVPLPLDRLLDIDGSWQKGGFFFQPEVFWTQEIWRRSGGEIDGSLYYSMDYDLWVRMALAGAGIVHVPDVLALFRVHGEQKTHGDLPFLAELQQVSRKHRGERG
ncbi:glycosyltransferase [Desulfatiglans anilini]|uniref:glycosyltransferase n=1 Tax=Desulfatiglans anilini TaxID=90728 RepID=UPI00041D6D74|nr:glycosyltransferase [Desulfatiglans anilini]